MMIKTLCTMLLVSTATATAGPRWEQVAKPSQAAVACPSTPGYYSEPKATVGECKIWCASLKTCNTISWKDGTCWVQTCINPNNPVLHPWVTGFEGWSLFRSPPTVPSTYASAGKWLRVANFSQPAVNCPPTLGHYSEPKATTEECRSWCDSLKTCNAISFRDGTCWVQTCPDPNNPVLHPWISGYEGWTVPSVPPPPVYCNPHRTPTSKQSRFIIGGQEVQKREYSFQVSLHMHMGNIMLGHSCGGSLIAPKVVLTAAHCLTIGAKITHVEIGGHSVTDEDACKERIGVADIKIHPQYDGSDVSNDIALVFLDRPSVYRPIRLPERSDMAKEGVGKTSTVSGWGLTHSFTWGSPGESSDVLQAVDVTIVPTMECLKPYGMAFRDSIICAGRNGAGSCQGDSGGPVFVRDDAMGDFVQLGVVSYGNKGCTSHQAYTRVSSYSSFLCQNAGISCDF